MHRMAKKSVSETSNYWMFAKANIQISLLMYYCMIDQYSSKGDAFFVWDLPQGR